jgi:hypothetical protein
VRVEHQRPLANELLVKNEFLIVTEVMASADGDPEKIFTKVFVNK